MADIRINALATTAASTASDDFVAVDGSANGTRKLNAYSPTFGGNLTVSGTGVSSFAGPLKLTYGTNLTGTDIGLFATSGGGLYINAPTTKNIRLGFNLGDRLTLDENTATFATNLTVSGGTITGGASGMSLASGGTNQNISITPSGSGRVHIAKSAGQDSYIELAGNGNTAGTNSVVIGQSGTDLGVIYNRKNADLAFGTNGTEVGRFKAGGNLILKSDGVDSSNGRLQLATHTTSAGGIGFGTDISLYRPQAGVLAIDGSQAALYLRDSGTTKGRFNVTASTLFIDGVDASGSTGQIILRTGNGGGTALTLDSSQRAIFSPARAASNLAVKIISSGAATNADRNFLLFGHNTAANAAVISQIDNTTTGAMSLILASGTDSSGAAAALTLDASQNATFAGKITAGTWADVVSARLGVATSANSYTATIANNASSGGAYALRLHTTGTASSDYIVVGSSGASAGSIRFLADGAGNFVVNNAAIATTATNGFLYVSTCAGTPTGTPTSYTGRAPIVVDTTNNKLYFYSGGAWRDAGP